MAVRVWLAVLLAVAVPTCRPSERPQRAPATSQVVARGVLLAATVAPESALAQQQAGHLLPDLVVAEDVGLHVDVIARRADCPMHRAVGHRPVAQQLDIVPDRERGLAQRLLDRQVPGEQLAALALPRQGLQQQQVALGPGDPPRQHDDLAVHVDAPAIGQPCHPVASDAPGIEHAEIDARVHHAHPLLGDITALDDRLGDVA